MQKVREDDSNMMLTLQMMLLEKEFESYGDSDEDNPETIDSTICNTSKYEIYTVKFMFSSDEDYNYNGVEI